MGENFCLKWNDYDRNMSSTLCEIREDSELLDITLACEDDKQLQAHKVILSACSPFFRSILRRNPHDHPLLYLRGVRFKELEAILHFIYNGEVNVGQDELNEFLLVAEDLKIKGLTQSNNTSSESRSHKKRPELKPITTQPTSSHNTTSSASSATTAVSRRRRTSNDNTVLVPGAKRSKLSSISDSPIQIMEPQYPQVSKLEATDSEIILPADVIADDNETSSVADITIDSVVSAEDDTFDESSIIEENYDGEDGEIIGGEGEGYVSGVLGGSEEVEQTEIAETNYTTTAPENSSGNPRGYVQCPVCSKLMYRKNLSRHIAVKHSNVKPVQCTLCERTMKNGWSLKEHERKYHGVFQSDRGGGGGGILMENL